MNLTVTARIAGGSGLVILLLVLLAFTGVSGVGSIEEGLNSVTDESHSNADLRQRKCFDTAQSFHGS